MAELSAERCIGCGLPVAVDERWIAHDEENEETNNECPLQRGVGECWCTEWCWEDGRCSADYDDMQKEIDRLKAALDHERKRVSRLTEVLGPLVEACDRLHDPEALDKQTTLRAALRAARQLLDEGGTDA